MNRWLLIPLLVALSLLLMAAGGLPGDYWERPRATSGKAPHDWAELERNMHPEACAQCHAEQFESWKGSLHAAAFSPGLIGQFPDMGHEAGNDCLKCHAPLAEQKFGDDGNVVASLALALKQPQGFHADGDVESPPLPLRHAGVTCAACHVRDWQRFGPPGRGEDETGKLAGATHGGFTADRKFGQSQFCASCHQFPETYAVNGKPLENTVTEWKQSRFAREGVQCQSCHMPDRRHTFKGIHDPATVRRGLEFKAVAASGRASLAIASVWIGHAFPTYVTPRAVVTIEALAANGSVLRSESWEISRVVTYENGWQEVSDTRIMPGEIRHFALEALPPASRKVRFVVDVMPDHFYKGVYQSLLQGELQADARTHIRRALTTAEANDYRLFEHESTLR